MGSVDDRTFKVNFSGEGAEKLRVTVKEKLKEFMGDYTDDTLVVFFLFLSFGISSPVRSLIRPHLAIGSSLLLTYKPSLALLRVVSRQ